MSRRGSRLPPPPELLVAESSSTPLPSAPATPTGQSTPTLNIHAERPVPAKKPFSLKTVENEGILFQDSQIKLNSKGLPQARLVVVTKTHLYSITLKRKKCKRRIPLNTIRSISHSPHWDHVVCVHVVGAADLLLVCNEKAEFVDGLKNAIDSALGTPQESLVNVCSSFQFNLLPDLQNTISFLVPDGTERKTARVFVDWQDSEGNSIKPNAGVSETPELADGSSSSSRLTWLVDDAQEIPQDFYVHGDGLDENDSEDEVTGKKVKVKGSTLLSKMMNVIPLNDKKNGAYKAGHIIERLTNGAESYVFFRWLLDSEENTSTGLKVREWQLQGGRDYMEDVVAIEYCLKDNLGELMVCMFDGHGGRGCAEWLGNNMTKIVEKQYARSQAKQMKQIMIDSFAKAQKKITADRTISDSGSTALVSIFRNGKIFLANTGDTRAVVFRDGEEIRLTVDHRVTNPKEFKRLTDLGATIKNNRVCVGNWDINLARSLGDKRFHPFVISDPDYFEYTIKEEDEFIVIATDGIWDSLSEEDVGRAVRQTKEPKKICSLASAMGSKDNLSVIIIFLRDL